MNIIGQRVLLADLAQTVQTGFPVFTIIVGYRGGGKKIIARYVGELLKGTVVECGVTVADVRTVIENSYKTKARMVYIFPDADKMSSEAKSALLKVTEEPPNNSYFIMTIESPASVPATILSRAAVCHLNPYTQKELKQYAQEIGVPVIVTEFCDTPGDIQIYKTTDVQQFLDYVELVFNNIDQVGTANSLKIGDRIALKENAQGYDLKLFWKAFVRMCMQEAEKVFPDEQAFRCAAGASITSKYLAELSVRGVNKNMLFLDWVLQLRKEWS